MELQHLRYFCEIVEHESITKAADCLFISQPSLSRTLKLLEDELGISLFERTGKGMLLTKEGAFFHREVRTALNILDRAKAGMSGNSLAASNELTIATLTSSNLLSSPFQLFRELYPEIKYNLVRPDDPGNIEPRNFDLCVFATPMKFDGLDYRRLYSEELVLLVASTHPLAAKGPVDLSDLRGESFIFPAVGSPTRRVCESLCNYAGFIPNIVASTNNHVSMKTYVHACSGIAMIPLYGIDPSQSHNLSIVHIKSPLPFRDVCISRPKGKHISELAEAFYMFMLDYFHQNGVRPES